MKCVLGLAAGVMLAGLSLHGAGARAEIVWTRTIATEKGRYIGWPSVARLDNGDILAVFSGDRDEHVCPFGKVQLVRSTDGGETWSAPRTIANGPIDDRDAGIVQLRDGTVVVTYFTSIAYRSAKFLKTDYPPGHPRHAWKVHDAKLTDDIRQKALGYYRLVSKDRGLTWGAPEKIAASQSPHGPSRMNDGALLQLGRAFADSALGAGEAGRTIISAWRSADAGKSWTCLNADLPDSNGENAKPHMFHEPYALQLPSGKIVGLVRYHGPDGCLRQTDSYDGGKTWTPMAKTPMLGLPPHLLRLPDGTLVCVYARRLAKPTGFGEYAMLSYDEGKTWDAAHEILLAPADSGDIGYPASCLLADGAILTVYYQSPARGVKPQLMATKWRVACAADRRPPVAEWHFDEGAGGFADAANDTGAVTVLDAGVTWASGAFGTALCFDGSKEAIAHVEGLPGLDGASKWSLSLSAAWSDKSPMKGIQNLLTSEGWGENGLMIYVVNGGVSVRVGAKPNGRWHETALGLLAKAPVNEWKVLTVTFDRPVLTAYVDGRKVGQTRWDEPLALKRGLDLGGWGSGLEGHRGLIGDLAFWTRPLSPEEVKARAAAARHRGRATWQAAVRTPPAPVAAFTNASVSIAFDACGQLSSIREVASGRELIENAQPFVRVTCADGVTRVSRRAERRGEDRLAWLFPRGGGEVVLSVTPFAGGWTFRTEQCTVAGAETLEWGLFKPSCDKWRGDLANMFSDEKSGVALRAYDVATTMTVYPAFRLTDTREHGLTGHRAGLAAGPRAELLGLMKAMTAASGAVSSRLGGGGSTTEEAVRRSYMFADLSLETTDEWIDQALRGGISTIHFHAWWEWLGQYPVRKSLFPRGLSDMKAAADRIHAAGLFTGMHTLTACINPYRDPWIFPKCPADLVVDRTYTLAKPLAPADRELLVNELPWEKHDLVFTYSGRGNALRIGSEIILYAGIRREKPYAFTGLTRGAFKTEKNALVPAGATCDYLHQHYIAFYPLPDSALADRLAANIAQVYNTCGMDQIYFDGAEGMGTRYGTDQMRAKIVAKLDQRDHPVLVESSCDGAYNWWVRARYGTVDYPRWAPKRFHDAHIRWCVTRARMGNLIEPQMGWWKPRKPTRESRGFFLDEMEYYGAKNAGNDAAMSFDGENVSRGPIPFHVEKLITAMGWYERFRMARAFAPGVKEALAVPGDEYRLRQGTDGVWRLTKTACHVHRISGSAARDWRVRAPAAAPAALRVEALYGAEDYSSPKGTNVLTASDVALFKTAAAPGVKVAFAAARDALHGETIRLTAENGTTNGAGAWARGARAFPFPYANFGDRYAFGFWVKGDGSGAVLNLQLAQPREYNACLSEHYVTLDFTGWRYVALLVRERDAEAFARLKWPYGGFYDVYRNTFNPRQCSAITLYVNNVPAGGKTDIALSAVRALPVTKPVLKAPRLKVGDQTLALPFDTLSAGDFAELEEGFWTHYSEAGEPLGRVAAPVPLTVAAGTCACSFLSEGRAEVTLFTFGQAQRALDADLTLEMRRLLAYEAPLSDWFQPAKGFTAIAPVTVRPGEKARLEVFLHDAVKNPTLTFPTWWGLSGKSYTFPVEMKRGDRLICRDGRAWKVLGKDHKTLSEGTLPEHLPAVKGRVDVRFSSADDAAAACRVSLVKRYL